MRARLAKPWTDTAAGERAEEVLRACVHCGMCNATCPTYELTGDELDGPRGRIYLIKQLLEGEPASELTRSHLDRCISCRACETTCPSGVEYHRLHDIGQAAVAEAVGPRPWRERPLRWTIRRLCLNPALMGALLALARPVRGLLPETLRGKVPPAVPQGPLPTARRTRRMTLLKGCVQAAAAPHINRATRRVFDAAGITLEETPGVGCCGALSFHLGALAEGRALARRNIDAWCAALDAGAEAVVVNASGCAAFIRDYPDVLADDPDYAPRARRVAQALRDPVEILETVDLAARRPASGARVAVHGPCTLRNGPDLGEAPARLLRRLGYDPQPVAEPHLCCGSGGAYSLLQPDMAGQLRTRKLQALKAQAPDAIYTANIGCLMHLTDGAGVPVRHWIEAVDDLL